MKKLAKITSATLEIKERDILSFWIYVDYEEFGSQGIGGFTLDTFDKEKNKRVGTAYGCEMIRRILNTLGVNDFSEMKGSIIWVYGTGERLNFKPTGIQSLNVSGLKNTPLIFSDVYNEFFSEKP